MLAAVEPLLESGIVLTPQGRAPLAPLLEQLEERRRCGQIIVTTNGCFDLIHPGHVSSLRESRECGDYLVVLLNSDRSVRQLKGAGQPILDEEARAAILHGIRWVDAVVLLDDLLPNRLLELLRPHVHSKAGDYVADELPEAAVVRRHGGEVRTVGVVPGYSSSRIIEKVLVGSSAVESGAAAVRSETEVCQALLAGSNVLRRTAYSLRSRIVAAAGMISSALESGGKILSCGNGGSAADAQHFAAELVGRYRRERGALAAVALTVDTSVLTAIGNDYGFEQVFARQVEAIGGAGDVLVAISTSGKSPNVLAAAEAARRSGLKVIGLTGAADSPLAGVSDLLLAVPVEDTPLIQQAHTALLHVISELIDGGTNAGS